MGLFQSCLAKNNEPRVVPVVKEEMETYEKVIRALVTEDMTEKRGGVAFDLTFISEKPPKMPSPKVLKNKKEDFKKWNNRKKSRKDPGWETENGTADKRWDSCPDQERDWIKLRTKE